MKTPVAPEELTAGTLRFVGLCRLDRDSWRFASTPGGPETLYASSFACMLLHYLDKLNDIPCQERQDWATYLNSWQDPESGCFCGPELVPDELHSASHSFEHVTHHLTAHVLPALNLLGSEPKYPLAFAHKFTDLDYLVEWLNQRNWREAWLEGNNLLFVGQFLVHLRDVEGLVAAQPALDAYFDWLDQHQDPATGLWGSNGYCSNPAALYGGYHQLLVYRHEGHPIRHVRQLVDVALSIQHADGGFDPNGGGGACEDTDAIDILVNSYRSVSYRRATIRVALRKALAHILLHRMPDGGFVYRRNEPFTHMGIQRTHSPANQSNLFPTWFRMHTLALIGEVLTDQSFANIAWRYNDTCSMGWHRAGNKPANPLTWKDAVRERGVSLAMGGRQLGRSLERKASRVVLGVTRRLLGEGTRV